MSYGKILAEELFRLLDLKLCEILHGTYADMVGKELTEMGFSHIKLAAYVDKSDIRADILLHMGNYQLCDRALRQLTGLSGRFNLSKRFVALTAEHQQKLGQVTLEELYRSEVRRRKINGVFIIIIVGQPSQSHARLLHEEGQQGLFGLAEGEYLFIEKLHGGAARGECDDKHIIRHTAV